MAAPAFLKTRFATSCCWLGGFHFGSADRAARDGALRAGLRDALRAAGFFPFWAAFLAMSHLFERAVFWHERQIGSRRRGGARLLRWWWIEPLQPPRSPCRRRS